MYTYDDRCITKPEFPSYRRARRYIEDARLIPQINFHIRVKKLEKSATLRLIISFYLPIRLELLKSTTSLYKISFVTNNP